MADLDNKPYCRFKKYPHTTLHIQENTKQVLSTIYTNNII